MNGVQRKWKSLQWLRKGETRGSVGKGGGRGGGRRRKREKERERDCVESEFDLIII